MKGRERKNGINLREYFADILEGKEKRIVMKCEECGRENLENVTFCGYCGRKMETSNELEQRKRYLKNLEREISEYREQKLETEKIEKRIENLQREKEKLMKALTT